MLTNNIEGLPDRSHVFAKPDYRQFIRHYGTEFHVSAFDGDLRYIKDKLRMLPAKLVLIDVLSGYSDIFKSTYLKEPNEAKREGEARREANTWLRNTINSNQ